MFIYVSKVKFNKSFYLLKKTYNHFDMGIYLRSLNSRKVKIGNMLEIKD